MIATINMAESGYYKRTVEEISEEMELVRAAQNNPRSFEPLYTRYYKDIVAYVYHRTENKEESFEITAQVFYKALENLPKYKIQGVPFSAWLFRIASNELNARFKKSKRSRIVSCDNEDLALLKQDMEESTSDHLDKYLFEALNKLETEEIELIDMRFFEKRPFKEIADIYGIGESNCKIRVYRIIEKLRTILKKN
jgi:RNA polymerase sigma-70 factor (ECF subfamily)